MFILLRRKERYFTVDGHMVQIYFSTGYKYFSENHYFSTADVSDGSACQVSHGHLNSNYSDKIIIIDNTPVQKA